MATNLSAHSVIHNGPSLSTVVVESENRLIAVVDSLIHIGKLTHDKRHEELSALENSVIDLGAYLSALQIPWPKPTDRLGTVLVEILEWGEKLWQTRWYFTVNPCMPTKKPDQIEDELERELYPEQTALAEETERERIETERDKYANEDRYYHSRLSSQLRTMTQWPEKQLREMQSRGFEIIHEMIDPCSTYQNRAEPNPPEPASLQPKFSPQEMTNAFKVMETLFQNEDLPEGEVFFREDVLIEEIQAKGITLALATHLIDCLIEEGLFKPGETYRKLKEVYSLCDGAEAPQKNTGRSLFRKLFTSKKTWYANDKNTHSFLRNFVTRPAMAVVTPIAEPVAPAVNSEQPPVVATPSAIPPTLAAETPTAERDAPAGVTEQPPVVATPSVTPPSRAAVTPIAGESKQPPIATSPNESNVEILPVFLSASDLGSGIK